MLRDPDHGIHERSRAIWRPSVEGLALAGSGEMQVNNTSRHEQTNLLTDAELDAAAGGTTDIYEGEVQCPVGHLTVVFAMQNGVQVGVGVRYHL
jgi:hypothetical protein